ncbi:sugar ABC transporter ATP-binding protein [Microbacterium sp. SSM24]|uniref:sugar ABC transporter ATP-binding protein n=1 Tax=Microbacterium sp. SSM24 TaxID=2991714 RepID=UPI0022269900|nr:sugar ABC transporter ATP-binding protein [Microbacterium sp. SSM24]MCW3492626.1 sugar ABC transporter ATP-binding protein [Microbacterium sp. SSM24]
MPEPAPTSLVDARQITVSFGGIPVVSAVDLDLRPGEVVALLGENGAGKSSLMKVIAGVYSPDHAEISVLGHPVDIRSVSDARGHGIAMVHQELNLVENLSISENIALGREPRNIIGVVDRASSRDQAELALAQVGCTKNPRTIVRGLSIADQQLVEIAKALAQDEVRVLLMDEPTSSLTEEQTHQLLDLIRRLRDSGYAIVITTHRIPEAFAVADRIVVMRDGRKVVEFFADDPEATKEAVVAAMIGRELNALFPDKRSNRGDPVLEVEGYSGGIVEDAALVVHRGEILGLGGLVGAGRTELARLIFGCDPKTAGRIRIDGADKTIRSPGEAMAAGLGFIPEDRKRDGLVLGFDVEKNISLPNLPQWSRFGVVSLRELARKATEAITSYRVRTRTHRQEVGTLSGGNQQKIVLAKWMMTERRAIILDEPTRGVDVGARQEIYRTIDEIARRGVAILLISSDMEELIGMSDRIAVMASGRIRGVLEQDEVSAARIFALASQLEEA